MKVLIFPTGDRLGQASTIDHYSRLGHEVFIPKFGSFSKFGMNWKFIAQWPALLCNDPSGVRNLEKHGFSCINNDCFGEDTFLLNEFIEKREENPTVSICNEEQLKKIKFDAYHTLRGGEQLINSYRDIMDHLNNDQSVWVSSTMNAWDFTPSGTQAKNVARIVPAPYEKHDYKCNTFNMLCLDTEYDLLNIERKDILRTEGVASFNHNFHARQPHDYALFTEMNEILKKRGYPEVINFGGNTRGSGADVRHSKSSNESNHYFTLSPKQNIEKYRKLKGVIHFKQTDWGGGVFFHCLHSATPMITTKNYVSASNSLNYLTHEKNCIVVGDPLEAAAGVISIMDNWESLSNGMKITKNELINDSYWSKWKLFIENAIRC